MAELLLMFNQLPVCPYCGHTDNDPIDTFSGEDMEASIETECGACGREYRVTREVEVTYTTEKVLGKDGEE